MKVAIVHDWFKIEGGAENVVTSLLNIYPEAEIFALVDFFTPAQRQKILQGKSVKTTFIQKLPFAKKSFQNYLTLFPFAIERLDLRGYDLIISSSHAVAKGVLVGPEQLHICYSHTPMRYAWDMFFDYKEAHNITGIKEKILSYTLHRIRLWDVISSNRVDHFIANSNFVKKRIAKYYRREAETIFPPVDIARYQLICTKEDYYFTASRLVPYKKIKMIVEAFVKNGKQLIVAGDGPEFKKIQEIATPNITLLGYVEDQKMLSLMQKAKAFIFAAYEDFGIMPVEAMSCGTPVIAYAKGGINDSVIDEKTGLFFQEQNPESLNQAIDKFSSISFDPEEISKHASKFSVTRFEKEIKNFIDQKYQDFDNT